MCPVKNPKPKERGYTKPQIRFYLWFCLSPHPAAHGSLCGGTPFSRILELNPFLLQNAVGEGGVVTQLYTACIQKGLRGSAETQPKIG